MPQPNPLHCYNAVVANSKEPKANMKAHVWVMLKSTVLDPQGQTIQRALSSLGYSKIEDVRQGKGQNALQEK